jgi:16S rRNA processing protein RimM
MKKETSVLLGVITGAHGIQGAVKIKSFTGDPADVAAYGPLSDKSGQRSFTLKIVGEQKGLVIATLEGIRDRNAAEILRGVELYVPRDRMPPVEEGEYFVEDLIGMEVFSQEGSALGTVKGVHEFGAGPILEIAFQDGREELYSFSHANFPEVDVHARRIIFCPPDVLIVGDKPGDAST